jgi:hypothetical protein
LCFDVPSDFSGSVLQDFFGGIAGASGELLTFVAQPGTAFFDDAFFESEVGASRYLKCLRYT